jgi:hypothetical protein
MFIAFPSLLRYKFICVHRRLSIGFARLIQYSVPHECGNRYKLLRDKSALHIFGMILSYMSKIERIVKRFRTERLYDSSHGYTMLKNLIVCVKKVSQICWEKLSEIFLIAFLLI